MLDQIKKYAPKTADALSKAVSARENSLKKISDYETQIKSLDEQMIKLESESCKNPTNQKINDSLESLSAKRYGLQFRYDALKNGTATFYSRQDLDKIVETYKNENDSSIEKRAHHCNQMFGKLREEYNAKVKELENELKTNLNQFNVELMEIQKARLVISQTMKRYYLTLGLSEEEILTLFVDNGLQYTKDIENAL